MKPEDAQLLATRAWSVEQICRWYGVAPVMVGHMEKTTAWGTGLEQMNLWFLTYGLRPILRSIEQEITRAIMTPAQRIAYYCEFNVEGLLRTDSLGRANVMEIMVDSGINTNEMRAKNNDPPLDGGDELIVNGGRVRAKDLEKQMLANEKPTLPPPDPTKGQSAASAADA